MAEDVFDSWEDMFDENGVLDRKLQDLKIDESSQQMTPFMSNNMNTNTNTSISSSNYSVWPSIRSNNSFTDNYNAIKILKRPTNKVLINSSNDSLNESVNDISNDSASVGPQVMLEDNTRTQYVPQVRILKRPNSKSYNNDCSDKSMSPIDRKSFTANKSSSNSKTYEEREAEYAKARLRILGSASAPETNSHDSNSGQTNCNSVKSNTNSANITPNSTTKLVSVENCLNDSNNVPVIRLPLGPDGSKGFKSLKR